MTLRDDAADARIVGFDWQEPKWRRSSGSIAGRNVLSTPRRRNPSCGDCRRLAVTMSASQPLDPLRVAGFEQFCSHEEAVLSSLLQRSRRSRRQVHRRFDPIVLFSIGDRGGIHNSMIPGLARRTSGRHEILLGGASDLYSNGEAPYPELRRCVSSLCCEALRPARGIFASQAFPGRNASVFGPCLLSDRRLGEPGGTRTHDPKIKSLVLYHLSYGLAAAP